MAGSLRFLAHGSGSDVPHEGSPADGGILSGVLHHVVMSNMGNSSQMTYGKPTGPTQYGGWKFPVITPGEPTTIIPIAFPLTPAPMDVALVATETAEFAVVFFVALVIWMLPAQCINKKMCCQCFRQFMSRRLPCYFVLGLILNIVVISVVMLKTQTIEANSLFFTVIKIVEKVTDSMLKVLTQLAALLGIAIVWLMRKKIMTILGFDQQILKADLRDLLTGFSMKRFNAIEVSLWHADGLAVGFTGRTLFSRVTLGYNEAHHTRPNDGCVARYGIKERFQLNYDPEDDTQKMSITIKMQEFIGQGINQLLPAAGAVVGAIGGLASPLGPGPGAAIGVVTGTGAANSVGAEIGRVDLSSAMINRIRERCANDGHPNPTSERPRSSTRSAGPTATGPITPWSEQYFQKVDLIPQGHLWLRIADIDDAP